MKSLFCCLLLCCASLVCADALTVTVLGPDTKPVNAARVSVRLFNVNQTFDLQTDAAGRCQTPDVAVTPGKPIFGLVTVLAPGMAVAGAVIHGGDNTVTLAPEGTLRGRVVDQQQRPVAQARVRLLFVLSAKNQPPISIPAAWDTLTSATTDAKGEWVLPHIPAARGVVVELDDPRYVCVSQLIPAPAPNVPPADPLVAVPGATLTGRLLAPDGKPATGVNVRALSQRPQANSITPHAVTDAQGRFHLDSLAAGDAIVRISDPQQRWVATTPKATLKAGVTTTLPDCTLLTGGVLDISVVDAKTGTPIPYATVTVAPAAVGQDAPAPQRPHGDSSGHLQLRTLAGDYLLTVPTPPPGYAPLRTPQLTIVKEGVTQKVMLVLSATATAGGVKK